MSILQDACTDPAVYWAPTGGTDEQGNPTYSEPVQIYTFWMDVNEVFTTPRGQQLTSKAKVFVLVDLETEGVLWHGRLANASSLTKPFDNVRPFAHEIQRFDKMPDGIDQEDFVRTAWL